MSAESVYGVASEYSDCSEVGERGRWVAYPRASLSGVRCDWVDCVKFFGLKSLRIVSSGQQQGHSVVV